MTCPYASTSTLRLLNSYLVYKLASYKSLVRLSSTLLEGVRWTPLNIPATWFIKNTFYRQFAGGEKIEELQGTVERLASSGIRSILDYAAESSSKQQFKSEDVLQVVEKLNMGTSLAALHDGARMALKLTAFYPYELLLSMSRYLVEMKNFWEISEDAIAQRFPEYTAFTSQLCRFVAQCRPLKIMIDAERLETQPAIDFISVKLMEKFNTGEPVVLNTYQMYLDGSTERMLAHLKHAKHYGTNFGVKLVRGAYLKSDNGVYLPSSYGPIFSSIAETHRNYDSAVEKVFQICNQTEKPLVDLTLATHNKTSIGNLIRLSKTIDTGLHRISSAQLYGMQDASSLALKDHGITVYKYVPYGPIELTIPYLIRRAQENSDVLRNSSELEDIRSELSRRFSQAIKGMLSP